MKIICQDCQTVVTVDESQFETGDIAFGFCPRCGAKVSGIVELSFKNPEISSTNEKGSCDVSDVSEDENDVTLLSLKEKELALRELELKLKEREIELAKLNLNPPAAMANNPMLGADDSQQSVDTNDLGTESHYGSTTTTFDVFPENFEYPDDTLYRFENENDLSLLENLVMAYNNKAKKNGYLNLTLDKQHRFLSGGFIKLPVDQLSIKQAFMQGYNEADMKALFDQICNEADKHNHASWTTQSISYYDSNPSVTINKINNVRFSIINNKDLNMEVDWYGEDNNIYEIKVFNQKGKNISNLKILLNSQYGNVDYTKENIDMDLEHDKVKALTYKFELYKVFPDNSTVLLDVVLKTVKIYHYFNFFSKSINRIEEQ